MDLINRIQNQLNNNWAVEASDIQALINQNRRLMKTLILTIIISSIALIANAQTYEASLNHVAIGYEYTPDDVLHSALFVGHKNNTYLSSRITLRPFTIESKYSDIAIEPLAFFEFGYDGSSFNNYGVGALYKINKDLSASISYSTWGVTASVSF